MKPNYLLQENSTSIFFENNFVKVVISKSGEVEALINKITGKDVFEKTETPWFTYLCNKEEIIRPESVSLDENKLNVSYANGVKAILSIDIKDCYFTITLESNLPETTRGIALCNIKTNEFWELDNPNAFGLSCVPMTTTVEIFNLPGGADKKVLGITYSCLGVDIKGSKLGVVFSRMTEHREHLKKLVDDIDPKKGLTSKHGGPYALDCKDLFHDYVIFGYGLSPDTVEENIKVAKKYGVEQLDMHQGGGSFIQGDFNFICLSSLKEYQETHEFKTPAEFKEKIADKMRAEGLQLALHTYSSLVPQYADVIVPDPKWNKQFVTNPVTWPINEDIDAVTTDIFTENDASEVKINILKRDMPAGNLESRFLLIDDEIIYFEKGDKDGFFNVERGALSTKAAPHKKGAELKQLYGWYNMFQPIVLSELFYEVARRTANAYNEGGFEMIYLDGLESFVRRGLSDPDLRYYYYAEFIREVVSNCHDDPIIEYSSFVPSLWATRGRGGAVDHVTSGFKAFKNKHLARQRKFHDCFYTATVGWFNYGPDMNEKYKDTLRRTMHRDDLDHMGSQALANDFSTVYQPFSVAEMNRKTRAPRNYLYYGTYSMLRKGGYFSPEAKRKIHPDKEYKILKNPDGKWVFREMHYNKHKVFDITDPIYSNGKAENPFEAQTPFVRIENRYSTRGENKITVFPFDESKPATDFLGVHQIPLTNVGDTRAFKIKVHGNGSQSDAILVSISSDVSEKYHIDFFVPVNFEGWREIILAECNNDDYDGYDFGPSDKVNRMEVKLDRIAKVTLKACGECKGVKLGEFYTCQIIDNPIVNPSVTINGKTLTFNATLHSGEYVEYFPEFNEAYLNYYGKLLNETEETSSSKKLTDVDTHGTVIEIEEDCSLDAHVKKIDFEGMVEIPTGEFNFSYNAETTTDMTSRAQVVFGFGGETISNPDSWTPPEIDIPEGIERVAIF